MNNGEKINLNATELLAQSEAMKSLGEEYEAMFTQVTSILNDMNSGWSENLSNNFVGKISSAQKGFAKIVEMLLCGQNVAKEAANSFEDLNAIMARQISGAFSGLFENIDLGSGVYNAIKEVFGNTDLPSNWQNIKAALGGVFNKDIIDALGQLDLGEEGSACLDTLGGMFDNVNDLLDGKINSDMIDKLSDVLDLEGVFEEIGFSDASALGFFKDMLGEVFDKDSAIMQDAYSDYAKANAAWDEGNYLEAITGYAFYGLEASTEVATKVISDGVSGLINTALEETGMDAIIESLPLDELNETLIERTGIDFSNIGNVFAQTASEVYGERVQETIDGIPIVVDYVGEQLGNGIEYVGNLLGDVSSTVADWFK